MTDQAQSSAHDSNWFEASKFGLFIHWGLYALRSRGEWAIYRDRISKDRYRQYADRFKPDRFDAAEWVAQAKAAGMKYIVFTSKHHDGFCMYDSAYTAWKVTNTPFGRDVLKEVAEATRAAGLRFGIYYSIWDLWHPGLDGGAEGNLDGDGNLKQRLGDLGWKPSREGIDYMKNQIRELLSNYGEVSLFWFDVRRAPAEAYEADDIMRMIRELQPGILVNNRLVNDDSATEKADLVTPENKIPPEGMRDAEGNLQRWESCMCYNKSWGYVREDTQFKGADGVVSRLVEIAGKGGNFLLNVGPNPRGELPAPKYPDMFRQVGTWLDRNGEGIYGTEPFGFDTWAFFSSKMYFTRRDDTLYVHVVDAPHDGRIFIPKIKGFRYTWMRLLDDGTELRWIDENFLTLEKTEVTITLPRRLDPLGVTSFAVEMTPETT